MGGPLPYGVEGAGVQCFLLYGVEEAAAGCPLLEGVAEDLQGFFTFPFPCDTSSPGSSVIQPPRCFGFFGAVFIFSSCPCFFFLLDLPRSGGADLILDLSFFSF